MSVKAGSYRHFKGGYYSVLGMGTHTETGEDLVVYVNVNEPDKIWLRPERMWNEEVYVGGSKGKVPRFEPLDLPSKKGKV